MVLLPLSHGILQIPVSFHHAAYCTCMHVVAFDHEEECASSIGQLLYSIGFKATPPAYIHIRWSKRARIGI